MGVRPEAGNLRLGLVGAGPRGRAIIEALGYAEGVRLARIASSNPGIATLGGDPCQVSADWRELLDAGDLDGLIVAIAPAAQAEIAEAAANAGLPVMLEAPLALGLEDARRLQRVFESTGNPVLVNHAHLFNPAWGALMQRARRLGEPRLVAAAEMNRGPFRTGVPPLWSYGPQSVAPCLELLGRVPESIEAERVRESLTEEGYGELVKLKLGFGAGHYATIIAGNLGPDRQCRFSAVFEKLALVFDDLAQQRIVELDHAHLAQASNTDHKVPCVALPAAETHALSAALECFADGIRGRISERFGLSLAVDVVRVLGACEEALPPRRV